MGLGVHWRPDIIAHEPSRPRPDRHCAGVEICLSGASSRVFHGFQPGDPLTDAAITLGQLVYRVGAGFAVFKAICGHHLVDIALDVSLQMREAALDLACGEVAAVDSDSGALQHADAGAELYEHIDVAHR